MRDGDDEDEKWWWWKMRDKRLKNICKNITIVTKNVIGNEDDYDGDDWKYKSGEYCLCKNSN